MKKPIIILLAFAAALSFVGCKSESVEDITKAWDTPTYVEVLTQIKNPEDRDLLVIDQDLILFDEENKGKISEFYRDTKTFIGESDEFVERYGYYFIDGMVNLTTPDSNWAWTETDDEKTNRYQELQEAFLACKDILKADKKSNTELIFNAKVKGKDLRDLHEYFKDLKTNEDVDLRFYLDKTDGKYMIKRLYLKGIDGENERLKESYVMNIDSQKSITIPKSLALHMITNGYKVDKENAITTKEEAEKKGYKPIK